MTIATPAKQFQADTFSRYIRASHYLFMHFDLMNLFMAFTLSQTRAPARTFLCISSEAHAQKTLELIVFYTNIRSCFSKLSTCFYTQRTVVFQMCDKTCRFHTIYLCDKHLLMRWIFRFHSSYVFFILLRSVLKKLYLMN